ncbi:MAG: hypothetical protein D6765_05625 [Bacteroidetes bacterium]|nr:MAG: hypothetical protein D6765_05625 [Bacteroidota bacterium]
MKAPNHIAGGTVFTGLFSSLFFGVNILASPAHLITTAVASLLPDIDHTKSPVGRAAYPIARYLNRRFGHRTLTHGIPCMLISTLVFALFEQVFAGSTALAGTYAVAYFSHLILDMFTLQGIPMLYPFSKNPFVLIGNPEVRIRSGDLRKEATIFCLFIAAGFTMKPLFEKGFWTTYNQQFATLKHLYSEFTKSDDLLAVEYIQTHGLRTVTDTAYCIQAKYNAAWLLDEETGKWVHLTYENCRRSFPIHTGRTFDIVTQTLINVSPDSLNRALQGRTLLSLEIQGNQPFQITEPNRYPRTTQNYTAEHLDSPPLFAEIPAQEGEETFIPDLSYIAQVNALQIERNRLKADIEQRQKAYNAAQHQLPPLRAAYANEADPARARALFLEIQNLEAVKPPSDAERERLAALEIRIQQIEEENRLRNEAKRKEIELRNQLRRLDQQPTRLTGIISYVVLSPQA